jgi:glycosyltransferase involved in cell wall biosynthesis
VTALVLTRNRQHWLPLAVQCAKLQTYKNKEILVVADGQDVRELIPDEPGIRYAYRPDWGSIGSKRNAGCELARGNVIALWDDDDFSAPGRLADQVERLITTGSQVTGYHTLRFTNGHKWWRYYLRPEYVPGTTLCFWKSYWENNRFPDKQVNEDGDFVERARPVLTSADAGDLMFATIHDQNTSPRNLNTAQWKEISV